MEWISVKDRLPDSFKSVLIWCPDIKCSFTAIWRDDEWTFFGGNGRTAVGNPVTHWQPLPPPPEAA